MERATSTEKLLRLLGMARRAGALLLGLDALKEQARRQPRMRVYIAPDLSARSTAEVAGLAERQPEWRVMVLEDFDRLRDRIGRRAVSVAGVAQADWIRGLDACRLETAPRGPLDHEDDTEPA